MTRNILRIVAVIASATVAAAIGVLISISHSQAREISQLRSEESRQALNYQAQLSYLQTQVSSLTVPTDPLSAYNEICNGPVYNVQAGINQTYYYPCTNNVQTIPQPGH